MTPEPLFPTDRLRYRLPSAARDILDGDDSAGGAWWMHAFTSLAFYCLHAKMSEDDYLELIRTSKLAQMMYSRPDYIGPHREGKLLTFAEERWAYAEAKFIPGTAAGVREKLEPLPDKVLNAGCWSPGAAGVSERLAALGVLRVAIERGAYTFNVSVRFLCLEAGLASIDTAHRALRALVDVGLITWIGKDVNGNRYRVNLTWTPKMRSTVTNNIVRTKFFVTVRSIEGWTSGGHPLFVREGLGPVAGLVYHGLEPATPYSVADVSSTFGLSRKAIETARDNLVQHGLATVTGSKFEITDVPLQQLDDIARHLGCLDWVARKAVLFADEQEDNAAKRLKWAQDKRAGIENPGEPAWLQMTDEYADYPDPFNGTDRRRLTVADIHARDHTDREIERSADLADWTQTRPAA